MPTYNKELHEYAKRHYYEHYSAAHPAPGYKIMVKGKTWKDGYASAVRAYKVAVKVSRMNADKEYVVVSPKGQVLNRLVNGVDQTELTS